MNRCRTLNASFLHGFIVGILILVTFLNGPLHDNCRASGPVNGMTGKERRLVMWLTSGTQPIKLNAMFGKCFLELLQLTLSIGGFTSQCSEERGINVVGCPRAANGATGFLNESL